VNVHDEISDDEVLRAASESLSAIPMAGPPDVEAIMARGDARRRRRPSAVAGPTLAVGGPLQRGTHPKRRHRQLATGLIAVAASAGLVLGLGLSGVFGSAGHQPSPPVHAQLAAWTVVKQADGTVVVRIREFRDPAGLQAKLRADGIAASVRFIPADLVGKGAEAIVHFKGNPCQQYSGGEGQAPNVVTGGFPPGAAMFVHPSAIPSGAGLQFVASRNFGYVAGQGNGQWDLFEWLVQLSPPCTGS
jgi:hypothetical protein